MKIAYIAHPISGDIKGNIEKIKAIVREINLTELDVVPFAPYIVDCESLNDDITAERERGIKNDIELFNRKFIDEVRLYGGRISNGMKAEIKLAKTLGIPVVAKTLLLSREMEEQPLSPYYTNVGIRSKIDHNLHEIAALNAQLGKDNKNSPEGQELTHKIKVLLAEIEILDKEFHSVIMPEK